MTKVEVTDKSDIEKEIHIELASDEMKTEREKTLRHLQKTASVKGFRKGKVPFSVLEKVYADRIDYELTDRVIQERIAQALRDNEFVPVVRPSLNGFTYSKDAPLSFTVKLDIKPKLEFAEAVYKGLSLSRPDTSATADELSAELDRLRDQHAQLEPLEGQVRLETGLVAIIDFEGTLDGKPFQGGSATNFTVEVGKGRLLPDFETALLGMTVGERKEFPLHFPADYASAELQGKTASFVVTVAEIKKKNLPQLDDEFAKDIGQESLSALKDDVVRRIAEHKERASRGTLYSQVIDQLTSNINVPVPQVLVDREKEATGRSEEDAVKRLKSDFILEVVARHQNCQIDETDLERKVKELALMNRVPVAEVVEYYRKNELFPYLQFQILSEKALEYIVSQADIHVVEVA